jgi:accessory gene regulator protein AgrB
MNSVRVAAIFFVACGVLAPLPYILGTFSVYYLIPIGVWSILLIYSSARLITSQLPVAIVRKHERIITMSMILLPLALILEALSKILGGLL